MTLGARLKLARAKAKMSMRRLAEQAKVSATAISKFERDEMLPRQSTLLRLARALSVTPDYFFREMTVGELEPAYRKQAGLGKRSLEKIKAEIIDQLERHLDISAVFGEEQVGEKATFPCFSVSSLDEVESAAEALRGAWELGLDPIEHIVSRLEDHGVKVLAVTAEKEFNGLSCWANGSIPVIVFNEALPGERQRFTIAHELGHLVLKVENELDPEKVAHRFAAAFLVPKKAALEKLGKRRSNLNMDELRMLKQEYGMSIQAWVRRAYDLGIIDEPAYRRLFIQIGSLGWRVSEPDPLPALKPSRLELLTHQALAEDLITPSYAAYLLGEKANRERANPSEDALRREAEALARLYATDPELTEFTEADF